MRDVVIVSAQRTPIGSFGGAFMNTSAIELGRIAVIGALEKIGLDPKHVDEVILGNVLQAGLGQNVARQVAIHSGIPMEVPSLTINKVCGSGLKAVQLAFQSIALGQAEVVVAGGTENMSQSAYVMPGARWGLKMGNGTLVDTMVNDGLTDAFNDYHMGITAENIVDQFQLDRKSQDELAISSQNKAEKAILSHRFKDEITPVHIPQRKGDPVVVDTDEYPKFGATVEGISKLRPAFKKDGSVTAATSSGINDGAAILIVMSREKAEELNIKPLVTIKSSASAGVDPKIMGCGPIPATRKALKLANLEMSDMDLIEANEAFAAQAIAVLSELNADMDKVNVNGGAIALGHPIGASGARILVTLIHEMQKREVRYGLATLCIGGGQGITMIVEKDNE